MTTKTDTPALCVGCQLPVFEEAKLLSTIATGHGVLCAACENDFVTAACGGGLPDWRGSVALRYQPPVRGVGEMRCEPWRAMDNPVRVGAQAPWMRDSGDAWRERVRGWLRGGTHEVAALRARQGEWLEAKLAAEREAKAKARAEQEDTRKRRALEARKAKLEAEQERARKELEELKAKA